MLVVVRWLITLLWPSDCAVNLGSAEIFAADEFNSKILLRFNFIQVWLRIKRAWVILI